MFQPFFLGQHKRHFYNTEQRIIRICFDVQIYGLGKVGINLIHSQIYTLTNSDVDFYSRVFFRVGYSTTHFNVRWSLCKCTNRTHLNHVVSSISALFHASFESYKTGVKDKVTILFYLMKNHCYEP